MGTEIARRRWRRLPGQIFLRRLNFPFIAAGILLCGLAALLILPYIVQLPSPHEMTVSLMIDGSAKWPPYKAGEGGFILGSDVAGRDILPIILLFIILRSGIRMMFGYSVPYVLLLLLIGLPRLTGQIADLTEQTAASMHIEAAVAMGAHPLRILLRHVVPVIRGPFLTSLAAEASLILVTMGQLPVLGVTIGGIEQVTVSDDPPIKVAVEIIPEWAQMMGTNWGSMRLVPWLVLGPALSLGAAAAAFQLLAEGLRRRG